VAFGVIEELAWFPFSADTTDWREMKGPAAANPALAQQTAPQRDRFERRLDRHRTVLLRSVGERLARLAAVRGWQEIFLYGDPRVAVSLRGKGLESTGRSILVGQRNLEALARKELERMVARELALARSHQELVLAERLRNDALAGGAVVLGIDETRAPLMTRESPTCSSITNVSFPERARRTADWPVAARSSACPRSGCGASQTCQSG
jgi:hypothetical protein